MFDHSLSGPSPPHSPDMISPLPMVYTRWPKAVPLQTCESPAQSSNPPPQATTCKSWAISSVPASQPPLQPLDIGISPITSTASIDNLSSIRIPADH